MPDDPIKKRMARAKHKAIADMLRSGYHQAPPECVVFYRGTEVRFVFVCLKDAPPNIRVKCPSAPAVSREIWIRKLGESGFTIQKF